LKNVSLGHVKVQDVLLDEAFLTIVSQIGVREEFNNETGSEEELSNLHKKL
jgi:hypothetical protein